MYGRIETDIPYPNFPRQKCDWKWTTPTNDVFMIEAKMMRLMGDNAKPNDDILTHILSPYPQQRSALTDCQKLIASGFVGTPTILIYGYEYKGYPLEPVIDAFEYLASKSVRLSQRYMNAFSELIHPVHRAGAVYAWTIGKRQLISDHRLSEAAARLVLLTAAFKNLEALRQPIPIGMIHFALR